MAHKVSFLTQSSPTYRLNGPKNLTWQKQCSDYYCDSLDLGINLPPESPESSYTAQVTAINSLGTASSFPCTFTLLDVGTYYFMFCSCQSLAGEHYFLNLLNVLCVIVSEGTVVHGKWPNRHRQRIGVFWM